MNVYLIAYVDFKQSCYLVLFRHLYLSIVRESTTVCQKEEKEEKNVIIRCNQTIGPKLPTGLYPVYIGYPPPRIVALLPSGVCNPDLSSGQAKAFGYLCSDA